MIILFTGPAAAGKNTIAQKLALQKSPAADIDVDLVRWMYRNPHFAPWEGKKGVVQMQIGAEHACLLANSFVNKGVNVFITDVVLPETVEIYRKSLVDTNFKIVQLLPSWEVVLQRLHQRPHTISDQEAAWVYESQETLNDVDIKLDTSEMTVERTVEKVLEYCDDKF